MTTLHAQPMPAMPRISGVLARALEPRKVVTVSEWAANNRVLSSKTSGISGQWGNDRNPMLVEPMDISDLYAVEIDFAEDLERANHFV